MYRKNISGWLIAMILCFSMPAKATHIVGGEFQFTNMNAPGDLSLVKYRITFSLYMDCINGEPGAIQREDVGIFYLYSNTFPRQLLDSFKVPKNPNASGIIPAGFSNECVDNPPATCLLRNVYQFDVITPNNTMGFYVATNNCCRNGSIINIINPNTTGASYFSYLPPLPIRNNSAKFKNLPPQIICVNNPFYYDHSATDDDGDSLSYAFGPSFNAKISSSGNQISAQATPPPYPSVVYTFGFTPQRPMGGAPAIQINPQTGIISGTPTTSGRFVVAVYCFEWRNHQIIDTVIREFQFVVTNCSKAVVANIPQYSDEYNTYIVNCHDFTVHFDNLSTGGKTYFWDFGVPGSPTATSTQFDPTFSYPDTGTYLVKLVVNRGSTCPDSIERFVKVYPNFYGEFVYSGKPCPNFPITFRDSSYNTTLPANSWLWYFGDGDSSSLKNPAHTFKDGGVYPVQFILKNAKGCVDTVKKNVTVERFVPFAGNDTIIVKGETINFNALGGDFYLWTPATNLSNPNINDPVGYYPDTGHFDYNVFIRSMGGCEGNDSIHVWVVGQSSVFVPTGFTPNGDGKNDKLKPFGIGYRNINYFRVFNRWGQQVFYSTDFNDGWDGIFNGVPQEIGTYFWVLSMTDRYGKELLVKGDAALLR
ncbi:MAG: gliding motility-associated C-terminal domain-containing protein [Bacteroidetes bacterium]|nr:gliding motility-associated C-terminal domain-containing protein [Bacteroidota bacterium]